MTGILEIHGIISWYRLVNHRTIYLQLWMKIKLLFQPLSTTSMHTHAHTHKQIKAFKAVQIGQWRPFPLVSHVLCAHSIVWFDEWWHYIHVVCKMCMIQQRSPTLDPPNEIQYAHSHSLFPFFCHFFVRLQPCFDDILIWYAHISIYPSNKNAWNILPPHMLVKLYCSNKTKLMYAQA